MGSGEGEESIEAAAAARRERLRALKAAQELLNTPDDDGKPQQGAGNQEEKEDEDGEEAEKEESIEVAAAARRERLRALKADQELLSTANDDTLAGKPLQDAENQQPQQEKDDDEDEREANVDMKFRNYLPHDKQLQEGKLAAPVLPKFEDPVPAGPPPEEKKEDPFLNIAPKKPNWDLRRDVQKRLDKLERRTQKAILILMEREEAKRSGEDIENGGEG